MSIARKTLIGSIVGSAIFVIATAFFVATVSINTADPHLRQQSQDQLVTGRELLKEEVETYFHSIENDIITYSNNEMIINAADQFKRSFATFKNGPIGKGVLAKDLRKELEPYYQREFGSRYDERNPNNTLSALNLLNDIGEGAVYTQYYFIQDNPNPLGEKDAMVKPNLRNSYARNHERFHPYVRQFQQQYGYYDIFIIEPENGTIIYSVGKKLDFGTSLLTGPYADSGLADVFRQAVRMKGRDDIAFNPYKPYTPSYEDPASFVASPIKNENGETIAVLAFQMPIDIINKLLTHSERWRDKGFGETGETYMVSEDLTIQNSKRELIEQPDLYFENLEKNGVDERIIETIKAKQTSIGYQKIETEAVKKALAGETGFGSFTNYAGEQSLTAYTNLNFQGYPFALIFEKAENEAFAYRGEIISSVVASAVIVTLIILSIIGFVVWKVTGSLSRLLGDALTIAETVAKGERANVTGLERDDEIGALMQALERMQSELISGFEERERGTARITQALDVTSTNLMLADDDLNIIYMNQSVKELFTEIESDLKQHIGQFDSSDIMGQNIDIFHKNPAHQRNLLAGLTDTYETKIKVNTRTLRIIANPVFDTNNERIGTVVEWRDLTKALAQQEAEQQVADENARIKQALDNVSASVMVADADRKIIYANSAVMKTLRDAESDLQKDLSNFRVDTMVGQNIDIFHKNPSHQMRILDQLNGTHNAKIVVGGRHMALTLNPVIDAEGNRLGTVVEWMDQTQEVHVQNEIDNLINAANEGKLNERMSLAGKDGFFKTVGEGLNTMLDKTANFVDDMGDMFRAMAEGDLTHNISKDYRGEFDEIKTNANESVKKLTEVMSRIQEASANVRSSANEVAQGSDDLSRRTESQASSLEETASSMEELTATVKQTAENSIEANELANEARGKAQNGGEVVQEAVNAMEEILDASNKINDIIGVIDEIAFQTNLLALNAAVEAARAGEQGRGFAVVAGEVRTLSQRSAAAAKEIKDLIRDSVAKVESGSTLVNQSGQTLAEIVSAVEKVASVIDDVSNAAREQNSGIGQINQAVTQMDSTTQQNAALVEESSAASRSMSEEAANMNNLISFFKLSNNDVIHSYGGTKKPTASTSSSPSVAKPANSLEPIAPNPSQAAQSNDFGDAASFSNEDDEWEEF